jgi:hypothetical protein
MQDEVLLIKSEVTGKEEKFERIIKTKARIAFDNGYDVVFVQGCIKLSKAMYVVDHYQGYSFDEMVQWYKQRFNQDEIKFFVKSEIRERLYSSYRK